MGRPRADAHEIDTTTRILEAAVDAFAARGHAGATLADIAAVAGITRPSLLYHFDTKDRLYEAAVDRVFNDIGALITMATGVDEPDDGPVSPDAVLALVEAFATFAADRPSTARLLLRVIVAADDADTAPTLVKRARPAIDRVVDVARRAGADTDGLRAAVTMVVMNTLARAATTPEVESALWGGGSTTTLATRLLFPARPAAHRL